MDVLTEAVAAARDAIRARFHDGRPCRRCDEIATAAAPAVAAVVGPAVLEEAARRFTLETADTVPWGDVIDLLVAMADELRGPRPSSVEERG